jgi:hypothetical protein
MLLSLLWLLQALAAIEALQRCPTTTTLADQNLLTDMRSLIAHTIVS